MELTITRLIPFDGEGSLKAFCDVAVGKLLLIKGVRVVHGRNGLFVSMPRLQTKDGQWHDAVMPLTRKAKLAFTHTVLEAYHGHTEPTATTNRVGRVAAS